MSLDKTFTEGRIKWCNQSWNAFCSTMVGQRSGPTSMKDITTEIQHLQLMVGSKMYPEYLIRSHAVLFTNQEHH